MALILSGTDGLSDIDGSASTPAIRGTDTNTGIFFPAADTIAFSEGGVEAMRLDANGYMGIGTTSPGTKLEIKGTHVSGRGLLNLIADSGTRYSTLSFTNNVTQRAILFHDNTDNMLDMYGAAGQGLRFTTNDSERMRIDTSGNVGIGTSSPGAGIKLDVLGGEIRAGRVDSSSEGGQVSFSRSSDNATAWYIDVFGNTSTPSLRIVDVSSSAVRATFDSGGNLLIGTTSEQRSGTTRTPRITSYSTTSEGFNSVISDLTYAGWVHTSLDGGTGTHYCAYFENVIGTAVGQITHNGSNTTYSTSSDYRLKENVQPMVGALAKVQLLKPVTYTWKESGLDSQGFIAHELQEVCPDAVVGEKDAVNEDGKPVYQGVDTSFLVATLTAAIQELKAEFDEYKRTHP